MLLCSFSLIPEIYGQLPPVCSNPPCFYAFTNVPNIRTATFFLNDTATSAETFSLITNPGPFFVVVAEGRTLDRLVVTISATDGGSEILESSEVDVVAIEGVATTILNTSSSTEKVLQIPLSNQSLLSNLVYVGHQDLLSSSDVQRRKIDMRIFDSEDDSSNLQVVQLSIAYMNEGPPVSTQASYTFSIDEDASTGDSVGTVVASDPDGVEYSIDGTTFAIESSTGVITVADNSLFDQEVASNPSSYELLVTVADTHPISSLSTEVMVTISINNINDNPPQFIRDTFRFTVSEAESTGYEVGTLTAMDPDNLTSSFFFQIKSVPPPSEFLVGTLNGLIVVQSSLDYEVRDFFEFEVEVSEEGSSERTTGLVQINITNVDDVRPTIQPLSNNRAYIDLTVIPPENGTFLNDRFEIIDDSDFLTTGFAYLNRTTVSSLPCISGQLHAAYLCPVENDMNCP